MHTVERGRFGQYLYERRQLLDVRQDELARRIGVSPQYLCDVEAGRRALPAKHFDALAKALLMEPDVLYYLAGWLPPTCIRDGASEGLILRAFQAFRDEMRRSEIIEELRA